MSASNEINEVTSIPSEGAAVETTTATTEVGNIPKEVSHEVTIFPEPIFEIGHFTVTNSLINSWLVVVIVIVMSTILGKSLKKIPGKLQGVFEVVVEKALELCDSVTNSRLVTKKVFPLVMGIFFFILLNNWLGLLPGVGSIGFIETVRGESAFVPLFRGGTADFNTTLAMALMSVIGANLFGVGMIGAWHYLNKFVNINALIAIPKKIIKDPTIIFVNPIKFFVGLVEIVAEMSKVASLSFRLFGNIFAGEVLLTSIALIFAFILPIPFMFLEVIVGLIQALIFAMLTLVYFTVASSQEEH